MPPNSSSTPIPFTTKAEKSSIHPPIFSFNVALACVTFMAPAIINAAAINPCIIQIAVFVLLKFWFNTAKLEYWGLENLNLV